MIYLIHVPSLELCKVGYAKDVSVRLGTGEAFIPGRYDLIAVREGGRRLEKAIHKAARAHHFHGEWFRSLDAIKLIFLSTTVQVEEPAYKRVEAISQFLAEERLTLEQFANLLGDVTATGVAKWARGERIPRPKQMRRLHNVTNGRVSANHFYTLKYAPAIPDAFSGQQL